MAENPEENDTEYFPDPQTIREVGALIEVRYSTAQNRKRDILKQFDILQEQFREAEKELEVIRKLMKWLLLATE